MKSSRDDRLAHQQAILEFLDAYGLGELWVGEGWGLGLFSLLYLEL